MTQDAATIRERLEKCAVEAERGIEAWKELVPDRYAGLPEGYPLEALLDTNGRPVLAEMYVGLGNIYAAIAALSEAQ